MNLIKDIHRYSYDGCEYATLKEVFVAVENGIGAVIDGADVTLTPKQKLNLLQTIVDNKEYLVKLLSVGYDFAPDALHGDTINILDCGDKV